jgi:hypothetical protein
MRCAGCGAAIQPGADTCISVCCPEHGKPLVVAVEPAPAEVPQTSLPVVRGLRGLAVALSVATVVGVVAMIGTLVLVVTDDLTTEITFLRAALELAMIALYAMAVLVAAVLAPMWTYQARRNLDALADAEPTQRPRMAVAAWFIPIATFWLVPRVINDVIRSCVPPGIQRTHAIRATWFFPIGWWFGIQIQLETLVRDSMQGVVWSAMLGAIAATGLLWPVWRITRAQAERFGPPVWAPPAPAVQPTPTG